MSDRRSIDQLAGATNLPSLEGWHRARTALWSLAPTRRRAYSSGHRRNTGRPLLGTPLLPDGVRAFAPALMTLVPILGLGLVACRGPPVEPQALRRSQHQPRQRRVSGLSTRPAGPRATQAPRDDLPPVERRGPPGTEARYWMQERAGRRRISPTEHATCYPRRAFDALPPENRGISSARGALRPRSRTALRRGSASSECGGWAPRSPGFKNGIVPLSASRESPSRTLDDALGPRVRAEGRPSSRWIPMRQNAPAPPGPSHRALSGVTASPRARHALPLAGGCRNGS